MVRWDVPCLFTVIRGGKKMIFQKGLPYSTAPTHSLRFPELDHIATSSQKGGQEHKYLACFSISKGSGQGGEAAYSQQRSIGQRLVKM